MNFICKMIIGTVAKSLTADFLSKNLETIESNYL